MALTISYRPQKFSEVVGQTIPKRVLEAVLKDPEIAPKTYLLHGPWGTGKSCLGQIFGRAINCTASNKPCGRCDNCKNLLLFQELDSAMMGNAKAVRELRESWYFVVETGWRVILIDELQVASPQAQAAFLKVLEEPPENCFFLLVTTNPEKILKPVISRSLELTFELLTDEQIKEVVNGVLKRENRELDSELMSIIIRRAGGHARDAVMLLEMALMLGKDEFIRTMTLHDTLYKNMIGQFLHGNREAAIKVIEALLKSPVSHLKVDLEKFILLLLKKVLGEGVALYKGTLDEKKLMQMLNYYVKIKPLLNGSSSDFYSALLGFGSILYTTRKPQEKLTPQFSKNL